ncbi:MAG: dipeptidase [Hyphomicrobiales bacterium]
MKKGLLSLAIIALMVLGFGNHSKACTNFLVTKGASTDGSSIVSYAADAHVIYGELYHWPAADYKAGEMLPVYEWDTGKYLGEIDQVAHTYNVIGNMNEHQLVIGETTYGGRKELKDANGVIDYGSLIYITLQRSKNAREAVKTMGELVAKYGYASSGESFSIGDPNEIWILELIGKGKFGKGAVWVARRIPDGYVSGHANQARITTFPLNDPENCIYSPDVITFARERGWYKGKDKDFSFSDVYAPVDFGGARFCDARVWTMFNKVKKGMDKYWEYAKGNIKHDKKFLFNGKKNPNKYASNRMPLWIKPDQKVSAQDIMAYMRDHFEGTELDMSKDVGAGAWGNPYRWRPMTWEHNGQKYCNERTTATQQTGFSFVAQCRAWLPREIGGLFWFGVDDASSTVYTPMYTSMTKVPETWAVGNGAIMDWSNNSAFWIFSQVTNLAYTRYSYIHPEVEKEQQRLENKFKAYTPAVDAAAQELYKTSPELAVEYLTDYSCNMGNMVVADWKKLYEELFMKYHDGNIRTRVPGQKTPKVVQPGYDEKWKKNVVEDHGDLIKVPASSH